MKELNELDRFQLKRSGETVMIDFERVKVGEFLIIDKILKEIDLMDLKNPICIQGMPGTADIGKVAVDQLLAVLKENVEKIIEISFDDYPAGAIINDALLYAPKAEVYLWKDPLGQQDIFLVTADAQPMSPRGIYGISEYISNLMFKFGVKQIITLGGFPIEHSVKNPHVFISATSAEILEPYLKFPNVEKISKGVVLGPNGLVPTLAKMKYDIEGVVLLAQTNGYEAMQQDAYDLRASIALINLLHAYFDLPFETQFTEEKIQGMETKLTAEKESIKEELGLTETKVSALNYFG
ncbi:MAG: PAC2 family protein [Candidatus Helarchaeota archaeon]